MNKDDLIERIRKIGKLNSRISVTNLDARDLVSSYGSNSPDNVLMYLDPPYVDKGPGLYLNAYEERDHRRLAALVAELSCHWVVSYDTHDLIREIYRPFQSTDLALHYSAQEHSRVGSELVFFSDNLPPPRHGWRDLTLPATLGRRGICFTCGLICMNFSSQWQGR
ncbi:DNA adenine methylase [Xanthomonas citri]